MILTRGLANTKFCYDPASGDQIHCIGFAKGNVAGYLIGRTRCVNIDGRHYPYWKIIATMLLDEFPSSVVFLDGDTLNTSRENLKFTNPTIWTNRSDKSDI